MVDLSDWCILCFLTDNTWKSTWKNDVRVISVSPSASPPPYVRTRRLNLGRRFESVLRTDSAAPSGPTCSLRFSSITWSDWQHSLMQLRRPHVKNWICCPSLYHTFVGKAGSAHAFAWLSQDVLHTQRWCTLGTRFWEKMHVDSLQRAAPFFGGQNIFIAHKCRMLNRCWGIACISNELWRCTRARFPVMWFCNQIER